MTTPINPANQIVLDPAYTYRVSDLIAAGKLHPHPENPIKAISEPIGWRQRYHANPLGLDDYYLIHDSQNSANFALWPPIKEPEHFLDEYNAQQAAAKAAEEEAKAKVPNAYAGTGGIPVGEWTGIVDPNTIRTDSGELRFRPPLSLEDAAKPWREAIGRRVLCTPPRNNRVVGIWTVTMDEFRVVEVSPLGRVKLRSAEYGSTTWNDPRQMELLESLADEPEDGDSFAEPSDQ